MQRWYSTVLYSTLGLMVNTSLVSSSWSGKVLCHGFLIFCNHMSSNNQFNKNEPSLNPQNLWQEHGQLVFFLPAADLNKEKPKLKCRAKYRIAQSLCERVSSF